MKKDNNSSHSVLLKDSVVHCVQNQKLNEEKLEKLLTMQQKSEQHSPIQEEPSIWVRWRPNFAFVALLIAAMTWYTYSENHTDYIQSIAQEVVDNHLNLKPLETSAHSIVQVQDFFDKLDFTPSNSSYVSNQWNLNDQQLIGGRYCSIQGDNAAQLRYKEGEKLYTLYQVGYDKNTFGSIPNVDAGGEPQEVMIQGLRATIWIEKGLLMALVSES